MNKNAADFWKVNRIFYSYFNGCMTLNREEVKFSNVIKLWVETCVCIIKKWSFKRALLNMQVEQSAGAYNWDALQNETCLSLHVLWSKKDVKR